MPSRSRVASTLTAVALTAALAACSDNPAADEAADSSPSASSSAAPAEADQTPSGGPTTDPDPGPEVAPFLTRLREGRGEQGSVHFTLTGEGPTSLDFEGDTSYGPGGNATRLVTEGRGGQPQLTVLSVDGDVYVSPRGVVREGKFFRLPADSEALQGYDPSGLSPMDAISSIEAGVHAVVPRGTERVGGVPAERFELHLDTERAMAALVDEAGGGAGLAGMPETLVYDVWLDEDDRVLRIRYEAGARDDPMEVTMELSQWGGAEPVTAPAEADLVDTPRIFDAE